MREQRIKWIWYGVMLAGVSLLGSTSSLTAERDPTTTNTTAHNASPTKPAVPARPESSMEKPTAPTDVTTTPVPAPGIPPMADAAKQKAQKEADARAQLHGTKWAIEWMPVATAEKDKAKPTKDTISFEDKQVTSERLSKAGYPSSNYTITVQDDGVIVWETMQTKDGEGVAFWRGELHDTTMRGVLSKHPIQGATEDYTVVGQRVKGGSSSPSSTGTIQAPAAKNTSAPTDSSGAKNSQDTKGAKRSKKKGP